MKLTWRHAPPFTNLGTVARTPGPLLVAIQAKKRSFCPKTTSTYGETAFERDTACNRNNIVHCQLVVFSTQLRKILRESTTGACAVTDYVQKEKRPHKLLVIH